MPVPFQIPDAVAYPLSFSDLVILFVSITLLYTILTSFLHRRRLSTGTPLRGPPSHSFLFGSRLFAMSAPDPGSIFEEWAQEYGSIYRVADALGTTRVMITDPKALAHFYSKEGFGYVHTKSFKILSHHLIGRGLSWSEGEAHRRQRKALTPAFSNAAIRNVAPIFFDNAYKVKAQWDDILAINCNESGVIEVQQWMNKMSLDTIGLAGFSHAFNTLSSSPSASTYIIEDAFASFADSPSVLHIFSLILAPVFPLLTVLPTSRNRHIWNLKRAMDEIGNELLERTRKVKDDAVDGGDKSVIGLLIKAESAKSGLRITKEELNSQMNSLLVAGYETTSITLTWALIELCKNPSVQQTLRAELLSLFPVSDPTYDQLTNVTGKGALPYLDAVVHEALRLHPAVAETTRIVAEDDILPLSTPLLTASGTLVNSVHLPKGTLVTSPIPCMNRSTALWGEDAKMFKPKRWMNNDEDAVDGKWKEIQGHRHILTFIDGPRKCLGKAFALAELKITLFVLICNFTFAFPSPPGVDTEIENVAGILIRPRIKGESGTGVTLRVGRVDA